MTLIMSGSVETPYERYFVVVVKNEMQRNHPFLQWTSEPTGLQNSINKDGGTKDKSTFQKNKVYSFQNTHFWV